jgi:hypothetical protein
MFCDLCKNFMEITKNVSNIEHIDQVGGDDDSETSNFDVSISSNKKITEINNSIIESILNGDILDVEINESLIIDINKLSSFNKLSSNQKTLVINRLYEKIPKNQKVSKVGNVNSTFKQSYFYCKNCGYNEKIPENMFIFSRNNEKMTEAIYNPNFLNNKNDSTLPSTKNYTCINDKCKTHSEPIIKKAVFYRQPNTYGLTYICCVCDNYWNTHIETNNKITSLEKILSIK